MEPLNDHELSMEVVEAPPVFTIKMIGTADSQSNVALREYVKKLRARIMELGVSEVVVDLGELEFMNSSCFKVFVTWVVALPDEKGYTLRLQPNNKHHWQKRSLPALAALGDGRVEVGSA